MNRLLIQVVPLTQCIMQYALIHITSASLPLSKVCAGKHIHRKLTSALTQLLTSSPSKNVVSIYMEWLNKEQKRIRCFFTPSCSKSPVNRLLKDMCLFITLKSLHRAICLICVITFITGPLGCMTVEAGSRERQHQNTDAFSTKLIRCWFRNYIANADKLF